MEPLQLGKLRRPAANRCAREGRGSSSSGGGGSQLHRAGQVRAGQWHQPVRQQLQEVEHEVAGPANERQQKLASPVAFAQIDAQEDIGREAEACKPDAGTARKPGGATRPPPCSRPLPPAQCRCMHVDEVPSPALRCVLDVNQLTGT